MKFHMKSSLMFLIITLILLIGMTAINASDVDQTSTQEIIKHNEVSTTTTTTASVAGGNVDETHKNDDNLKEEETTIEKVNNTKTKTITKQDTTESSNKTVKTIGPNEPVTFGSKTWQPYQIVYVNVQSHTNSYDYDRNTTYSTYGPELPDGDGTFNNPCSIYKGINLVRENGLILLLGAEGSEVVYETRANAPWINYGGTYYPGKLRNERNVHFTIMGEEGKTIVWSGLKENTNMFSLSEGFNATLINIVFRDGNASGLPRTGSGAGPTANHGGALDNRGNLTVINCTFDRIYANENGGAIANYEAANTIIENCTFRNIYSVDSKTFEQESTLYGGAISNNRTPGFGRPQVTVKNSNFTDIHGEYGAVFFNNEGDFTIENIIIDNARATVEGGAIVNYNKGNFTIKNTTITNVNSSDYGGAIANLENCNMTVDGINITKIHVNTEDASEADMYGGTIYNRGNMNVSNAYLDNLTADFGAAFSNDGGQLFINNTHISHADAHSEGGAIVNKGGKTIVNNTNITDIDAHNYGGAVANIVGIVEMNKVNITNVNVTVTDGEEEDMYGGTIFNKGNLTINDSTLQNMSADFGAAFSNKGGQLTINNTNISDAHAQSEGGAIINNGGKTVIDNVNMTNMDSHKYGGALANLAGNVEMNHVNITDVDIDYSTHDKADMYGGTIYNKATLTIVNSSLTDMEGDFGAAFSNIGGKLTLNNVTIEDATALSEGGAIINYNNSEANLNNVTINNVQAVNYGGAIANSQSTLNINDTDMSNIILAVDGNFDPELEYFGGTILNNKGNVIMSNSSVTNVSAADDSFTQMFGIMGGVFSNAGGNIIANNNTFHDIDLYPEGMMAWGGVIVNFNDGIATFAGNEIYNTAADIGGAVYNVEGSVTLSENYIHNISMRGAIIHNDDKLVMEGNRVIDNVVGDTMYQGQYNTILENMGEATIVNNYFENNTNDKRDMLFNDLYHDSDGEPIGSYDLVTGNIYIDNIFRVLENELIFEVIYPLFLLFEYFIIMS